MDNDERVKSVLLLYRLRESDIEVGPEKHGTRTAVRTVYGNSRVFTFGFGMHQRSCLSSLLFATVMEVISMTFWVDLPWQLQPHASSWVVRLDPLHFLAGCRTR